MKMSDAITKRLVKPKILPETKLRKGIMNWGLNYTWVCSKCDTPVNLIERKLYWACNCNIGDNNE